ncbi:MULTISPECIES: hypothetical protein [Pseudomonas]|uniref:Uncharacterized protein n=1 Tax=Pseudomonas entomophila TaxID=312306 RepID=A0A3S8UQT8_9PSED|nr:MULTISPECIES: hypothetical protein [Pseudomonas]AZL70627.1 hypothetical protein EJA05_24110 [Pseudomonas oryziphila]
MSFGDIVKIFERYKNFKGWHIRFFGYEFEDFGVLNVKIEMSGAADEVSGEVLNLGVKVCGVVEVRSDFVGGKSRSIFNGVRFSTSGIGGYCLEFDGFFEDVPITLDVIRRRSDCYIVGKSVEIFQVR